MNSRFAVSCGALLLAWPLAAWPQELRYIFPSQTDPGLTNYDKEHIVSINTNLTLRQQLFLFLPATGAIPGGYTNVLQTAAGLGFHSIGLMYANDTTVNSLCGDATNSSCFEQIRLDVIAGGTNSDPAFSVSRNDSIENRLTRLIQYLNTNHSTEHWSQYLDTQTNIVWAQIVVAGHSQGAGHSGLIAKLHPVLRSLMFADTDWWNPGNRPADWIIGPGVTANELFFGFIHTNDHNIIYSHEIPTWDDYGMNRFGPPLLVESNAVPFRGSHMLTTALPPQGITNKTDVAYHLATVSDEATPLEADGTPVYQPVWQWMMTGPPVLPMLQINLHGTNVQLIFDTHCNYVYQLQETKNLVGGTWSNSLGPIPGDGASKTDTFNFKPAGRFYRVSVAY